MLNTLLSERLSTFFFHFVPLLQSPAHLCIDYCLEGIGIRLSGAATKPQEQPPNFYGVLDNIRAL